MRLVLQNVQFNLRLIGKFTMGELTELAHESVGQATTSDSVAIKVAK